ncbi:acetolactate synthase-1/2/3 large subunit [Rhodococcus sp. 27YEA15]|uniref:thiamine pyrophosphate-binding protein n=1 Tax=Rhodococcus sp. 27YEA15 TaxID=3156259 RepID=UPI003C7BF56F
MQVNQAIAAALIGGGVDTMFGLIGDSNLFMVNEFVETHGGRYVSAVHEASSVMMAHGYASRSGRVGVATVTQGPGLTNTATALVETVRASTPLVMLIGDTAPSNLRNLQSLAQEPFVRATGAEYLLVESPETAAETVCRALRIAAGQSRPVVVNCPTEYMWVEVAEPALDPSEEFIEAASAVQHELDEAELDTAVGLIASATRPLVVVGRGVVDSNAGKTIKDFSERLGAPLLTTLRARNLYGAGDGSLGVFGTLSSEKGAQAIVESDCVVVFGASLNTWTTAHNTLLTGKPVVHVDVQRATLGRFTAVTAPVCGDAATVAEAITTWLDEGEIEPATFRARVASDLVAHDLEAAPVSRDRLSFAGVLTDLMAAVDEQRTVVFDGGRFLGEAFAHVHAPGVARQVLSTSFGAIGMGMGAAIGAAVAASGEPTVLVTGDGGFMMNGLAELQSAVRQQIPLTVLVCNDGSYGAEYDQYVAKGVRPDLSLFEWPSFADVATALGAAGVTVGRLEDVSAAVEAIRTHDKCLVIDIQVGPDQVVEVPH